MCFKHVLPCRLDCVTNSIVAQVSHKHAIQRLWVNMREMQRPCKWQKVPRIFLKQFNHNDVHLVSIQVSSAAIKGWTCFTTSWGKSCISDGPLWVSRDLMWARKTFSTLSRSYYETVLLHHRRWPMGLCCTPWIQIFSLACYKKQCGSIWVSSIFPVQLWCSFVYWSRTFLFCTGTRIVILWCSWNHRYGPFERQFPMSCVFQDEVQHTHICWILLRPIYSFG